MITCIHQRNEMTYFDVSPSTMKKPFLEIVCNGLRYGSTVFTDEYRAYNSLGEHGFIQKSVNRSEEKEYANGIVQVNNYVNVEVIFTS